MALTPEQQTALLQLKNRTWPPAQIRPIEEDTFWFERLAAIDAVASAAPLANLTSRFLEAPNPELVAESLIDSVESGLGVLREIATMGEAAPSKTLRAAAKVAIQQTLWHARKPA